MYTYHSQAATRSHEISGVKLRLGCTGLIIHGHTTLRANQSLTDGCQDNTSAKPHHALCRFRTVESLVSEGLTSLMVIAGKLMEAGNMT